MKPTNSNNSVIPSVKSRISPAVKESKIGSINIHKASLDNNSIDESAIKTQNVGDLMPLGVHVDSIGKFLTGGKETVSGNQIVVSSGSVIFVDAIIVVNNVCIGVADDAKKSGHQIVVNAEIVTIVKGHQNVVQANITAIGKGHQIVVNADLKANVVKIESQNLSGLVPCVKGLMVPVSSFVFVLVIKGDARNTIDQPIIDDQPADGLGKISFVGINAAVAVAIIGDIIATKRDVSIGTTDSSGHTCKIDSILVSDVETDVSPVQGILVTVEIHAISYGSVWVAMNSS